MNPKNVKRICVAGAALAIVATFLVFLGFLKRSHAAEGPVYQGHSLAGWIHVTRNPGASATETKKAEQAIEAMGTNVVPGILWAMDQPDDGRWKPIYELGVKLHLRKNVPTEIQWSDSWHIRNLGWVPKEFRSNVWHAVFGEYLKSRRDRSSPSAERRMKRFMLSLSSLGPVSEVWTIAELTNHLSDARAGAVSLIGSVGRPPPDLMPRIGSLLDDPSGDVRFCALNALGNFRPFPAGVVSNIVRYLRRGLDDREQFIRTSAATMLSRYGLASQSAAPRLSELILKDPLAASIYRQALDKVTPLEPNEEGHARDQGR